MPLKKKNSTNAAKFQRLQSESAPFSAYVGDYSSEGEFEKLTTKVRYYD